MATSPIYSWPEPDNTDLVKNGALAIRTLGDAIDTTMGTMVAKTIVDAKGDLIAATAADTVARLAVGTNGQTLVADSSTATGLKWATPAAGGKVLQVVSANTSTYVYSSSSTYADTGLTATITPTLATSKILVLITHNGVQKHNNTNVNMKLLRAGSDIALLSSSGGDTNNTDRNDFGTMGITYLDNPATTSATIYKTQYASAANTSYALLQVGSAVSSIVLMEIGA